MLKQELIKRSPIRILEKTIHGGLGKGNLGVFAARKGVGKTACLAHVAIDKLFNGQKVLHVSFADNPHHIENWYRQVFEEVARSSKLVDPFDIYDEIKLNRLIIHFKQPDIPFEQVQKNVELITGGSAFRPTTWIVDGYSFYDAREEEAEKWKRHAAEQGTEMWFSATLHKETAEPDVEGIPYPISRFKDLFSVIILLNPVQDYIALNLLKDHDSKDLERLRLKLDPKTLLISNHRI
jgi:hypothetical protein